MTIGYIISKILIYIIIFGGLLVGVSNLIGALRNNLNRRFTDILWTKWAYSFVGFYLCFVYAYLEFFIKENHYLFTSTYVRPSMAVLIILVLIGRQRPVYLPDLIKEFFQKIRKKGVHIHGTS